MTMTVKKQPGYRQGRPQRKELSYPDIPYTMKLADGRTLYVEVPGRMGVKDRSGEIAFTPEGVKFLDKIRALATKIDVPPRPAFITALREAAGMTQEELGQRIGRDKLTVSRWERGTVKPGRKSLDAIKSLFRGLKQSGIVLPG